MLAPLEEVKMKPRGWSGVVGGAGQARPTLAGEQPVAQLLPLVPIEGLNNHLRQHDCPLAAAGLGAFADRFASHLRPHHVPQDG
jgi:hypothetical protein